MDIVLVAKYVGKTQFPTLLHTKIHHQNPWVHKFDKIQHALCLIWIGVYCIWHFEKGFYLYSTSLSFGFYKGLYHLYFDIWFCFSWIFLSKRILLLGSMPYIMWVRIYMDQPPTTPTRINYFGCILFQYKSFITTNWWAELRF